MFVEEITSGDKVKVSIKVLDLNDLTKMPYLKFDWGLEHKYEIYKLVISRTDEILGLLSLERIPSELRIEIRLLEITEENIGSKKKYDKIAGILIAFACKESFQNGFFGFISLVPKTKLIKHYIKNYGFKQFGRHVAIELKNSELLINKYLHDE